MSIHNVIASLKEQDKKKFFELRNAMRRAYLISMNKTIGIDKYGLEDDIQMDAIDTTIGALMQRAGMDQGENEPNKDRPEILTKEVVTAEALRQLEAVIIPQSRPWGAK